MSKHDTQESSDFNPFGELLGLTFSRFGDGQSQCQLTVRPKLLNPYGVLHGGVVYSMADTAMGAALYSRLKENERCATIEMKVSYFQAVTSGELVCTAAVVHRSRRVGFVEAEVRQGDNLVAKASGTFMITESRRGGR